MLNVDFEAINDTIGNVTRQANEVGDLKSQITQSILTIGDGSGIWEGESAQKFLEEMQSTLADVDKVINTISSAGSSISKGIEAFTEVSDSIKSVANTISDGFDLAGDVMDVLDVVAPLNPISVTKDAINAIGSVIGSIF